MLRYNNFKSGGWKPITFVVREHSSKTHTYWIFFLAASSDIITYISVFKPIKQWKGKQKFRCLMDLLIICLGTRKIMLQCITCRVQTSTLNISGKPTIVIIWIFYNMKNASVKVGGVALKRSLDMVGLQGQTKSLHFTPPFQTECFWDPESFNFNITIFWEIVGTSHAYFAPQKFTPC